MSVLAREAAKLFNSSSITALADGDRSFVENVAKKYLGKESIDNLAEVFDAVLARLGCEYRSEYYFKNSIAVRHLLGRHSLNTATMLSEFRVGASKADCVILNGKSTCYEIKTEYDSLSRLDEQLSNYLRLFDEVFVVCAAKNLSQVLAAVPEAVGVLELSGRGYLSVKKKAKSRQCAIDLELMMKSLRKEEYLDLVRRIEGEVPKVPNTELYKSCLEILKKASQSRVEANFVSVLKKYRVNKGELIKFLPNSLVNAAISYRISDKQSEALKRIFMQ